MLFKLHCRLRLRLINPTCGNNILIIQVSQNGKRGTYLIHILLRATVDTTTRAALSEKPAEKVTQREKTAISIAAAHDCLVALTNGFCHGLGGLLVTVIRGHGEGRNSQNREGEDVSHFDGGFG